MARKLQKESKDGIQPEEQHLQPEGEDGNDEVKMTFSVEDAEGQSRKQAVTKMRKKLQGDIIYGISDKPPWLFAAFLGLQHFLTMFGSSVSFPMVLSDSLCISNPVDSASFIGTTFFVCGFLTILQSTFGVRLPIVQGASAEFLVPALAMLKVDGDCPPPPPQNATFEELAVATELWQSRLRPIQGAIMVASTMQMVMGLTGMVGVMLRFIGPVTVASTIGSIGIILFPVAAKRASAHWGIAIFTAFLIILFSQVLNKISVPFPGKRKLKVFSLFSIMFAVSISWLLCGILTLTGVLPDDPDEHGYLARTDVHKDVLKDAPWFKIPYPGQWGAPVFLPAVILGMFAGALASIIDSVSDYHACSALSGAPPPPAHAINRGIAIEGIGCFFAGLWGSGTGSSSYISNIAAIGLTKVASVFVIQICGVILVLVGVTGKINAIFTTIPDPVIGGMLAVTFGIITTAGFANLQYVDLKSTRNLLIVGISVFCGVIIPQYASDPETVITGVKYIDDLFRVTLSTGMLVAGFIACVLDNAIPGSKEQRGFTANWHASYSLKDESTTESDKQWCVEMLDCYDLPFGMDRIRRWKWTRYLPFSPTFRGFKVF